MKTCSTRCRNGWIWCHRQWHAAHRRASVRHAQGVDGGDPLPDQNAQRVSTEMSLQVLAYNMKRVIAIMGIGPLMQATA